MTTPPTTDLETFEHLELCQTPGQGGAALGNSLVDLSRRSNEVACLAWDTSRHALVELHLLAEAASFSPDDKRGFSDLAGLAKKLVGEDFGTVLDHGESGGFLYYTTPVSDGELLPVYVARVGPSDPAAVVPMVRQLGEALARDEAYFGFVPAADPERVMVVLDRSGRLRLRLVDFGLTDRGILDAPAPPVGSLGRSLATMLSLLLTTHPTVESPHFAQAGRTLPAWPRPLENLLRRAFTAPTDHWPLSLSEILDSLRDAELTLQSSADYAGDHPLLPSLARRPRTALEALIPAARQARELLEGTPDELAPLTPSKADRSCLAVRARGTHEPYRLLLLPGRNVIAERHLHCVPVRRADAQRETPHLVRVVHSVRSEAFRACIEECPPHLTLEDVLTTRQRLTPAEALLVLDQVVAGLSEAETAGVEVPGLTPCDVWLLPGNAPSGLECERLAGQTLETWPALTVKLRVHLALPSLMAAALDSRPCQPTESAEHRMAHEFFKLVTRMLGDGTEELRSFPALRRLSQWHEDHRQPDTALPVAELLETLRLRLDPPAVQAPTAEAAIAPPVTRWTPIVKPAPHRPSRYDDDAAEPPARSGAAGGPIVAPPTTGLVRPAEKSPLSAPSRLDFPAFPAGRPRDRAVAPTEDSDRPAKAGATEAATAADATPWPAESPLSPLSPVPLAPPAALAPRHDSPLPQPPPTGSVRRQLVISLEDARGRNQSAKTLPLPDDAQPRLGRLAAEFRLLRPARVIRTGPVTAPVGSADSNH